MDQRIKNIKDKTILITPLDWGLGHATRCIPIIRTLTENNNTCIIASSGRAYELLKQEFPTHQVISIPAYGITYGKSRLNTFVKLLMQIPKSLLIKNAETKLADEIVEKYNIDIIISDNRFGMHSNLCKSIFISHQIRIRLPLLLRFLEYPFYLINKKMISKFDECWIPDYEGTKNLSGILSHSWKVPRMHYIGPLTAREKVDLPFQYDVVAILSGPEPQRSILEKELRAILPQLSYNSCIIRGVLGANKNSTKIGNCKIVTFATNEEINNYLSTSKLIISRSGYSSIMDYEKLNIKAILIPTPGQTEQIYLGKYLALRQNYWCVMQHDVQKKLPVIIREVLAR